MIFFQMMTQDQSNAAQSIENQDFQLQQSLTKLSSKLAYTKFVYSKLIYSGLLYSALSLGVLTLPLSAQIHSAQISQAQIHSVQISQGHNPQASSKGSKSNGTKDLGNKDVLSKDKTNVGKVSASTVSTTAEKYGTAEKLFEQKAPKSPYILPIADKAIRASYPLETCYDKTTHIIFPSKILYVDIGSSAVVADKAEPSENVLRVKANTKGFEQTTLVVITEEGKYYPFLVDYNPSPLQLNISIAGNVEKDAQYAQETGIIRSITPEGVTLADNILSSEELKDLSKKVIYNRRFVHNVGVMKMRMSFLLTGVYVHEKTMFLQVFFENRSDIDYEIDFFKFFLKDRDVTKRMAYQEFELPTFHQYPTVPTTIPHQGKRSLVFALPMVTYGEEKILEIQVYENKGGRHLRFEIDSDVIIRAKGL
ncbi:conjugative transposon protein TraN [Xanthocytophaga flava]|uniref:conjugative transposon protein TraN n=1 Tax=Xanthocytophaga flava TaxID=3048013 RepID=UPI0028D34EF9|nr:conjugative transposon protein TraN [Xanthocytophaga flavus]MDJ1470220.1 conjugative transposon protein TraN [Xanthocytophaga flavus]